MLTNFCAVTASGMELTTLWRIYRTWNISLYKYGLLLILAGICISFGALFLYRQTAIKELEHVSQMSQKWYKSQ